MELSGAGTKYEVADGRLLGSSRARHWRGLHAELRSHGVGRLESFVQPVTELALLVRGEGRVRRRTRLSTQCADARPGAIWLCPAGTPVDFIELCEGRVEILHLFLQPAALLAGGSAVFECTHSLRYAGAFSDPLIEAMGKTILAEMAEETAAGSLLVESLSGSLAARLFQAHAEPAQGEGHETAPRTGKLDARRLHRVLDYIEAHLEAPLGIDAIAEVAHLSRFHFNRAFKATMGKAPCEYVSAQRMRRARQLLIEGRRTLADIALALNFSSQANFTRAFSREVGTSPGRYREQYGTQRTVSPRIAPAAWQAQAEAVTEGS